MSNLVDGDISKKRKRDNTVDLNTEIKAVSSVPAKKKIRNVGDDKKEELDKVTNWILKLRNKFCPATSYDRTSRSSRCIVDGYSGLGNASCVFSKFKDFRRIFACEQNNDRYESLKEYFLANKRVDCINDSFVDWFHTSYSSLAPQALVYLDASNISIDSQSTDISLFLPDKKSLELCDHVKDMLSGKNKCPMVVVKLPPKLPQSYVLSKLQKISTRKKEFLNSPFLNSESQSFVDSESHSYVALIGYHNKGNKNHSSGFGSHLSIPPASSRRQIIWLLEHRNGSQHHHYQRLKQLLCLKLKGCRNSHNDLVSFLTRIVFRKKIEDDEEIYDQLAQYFHTQIVTSAEYKRVHSRFYTSGGRADYRVRQIKDLLRGSDWKPRNLLDVGCSEGSITAALGKGGFHMDQKKYTWV